MENFDIICRTCNTERSNLVNIYSIASGNDALKLHDMLLIVCPSLTTQGYDKLPQKICYFCSKQLEIAYEFQLQCEKAHKELWKIIEESIKKEPVQTLPVVENEDPQEMEKDAEKLNPEEEFVNDSAEMTENLEFLDEYEMEDNDADELPEETPTTEESPGTEEKKDTDENSSQSQTQESVLPPRNEAPIMCCHCDKTFFTANGLRLHEKLAHKNLKPILIKAEILTIECKYCFQVFERRSELMMHTRLQHKRELANEFTCNFCHKTFSGKNRYDHHLLYHAKSRYQCQEKNCTRSYVIKYKLTDHMRRFHGITLSASETRALKPNIIEES